MVDASRIQEGAEVVGADGVHVGYVDHIEAGRIRLKRKDAAHGITTPQPRYLPLNDVGSTEDGKVWMAADAALVRYLEEQDKDGKPA
ncbi:DUF2171 domain-containing protein [Paracoccus limosus]|jgi:hypothetical protein|uniref:DUF2171 domain-containing protein n=1 Tax=Paracoccus limosus TaxID=913252 RepID=A0A844H604_9RHOB|nr:DUF2171 domain-containing protein [Paracoccus limosus]MTH36306.1 DUF2171 domain-containing protein [Paracoccus limosus]